MITLVRNVITLKDGTEISADNNTEVIAMDWQICGGTNFDTPILESKNDNKNLSSITFTTIPTEPWKARARAQLKKTGWTDWSYLDTMSYAKANENSKTIAIPSKIATPQITTSSLPSNHEAILFTIFANGFSVNSNASHSATTWFIEDVNENIIWSSLKDTINLTQIEFKSMMLRNNNVYRIRAMFHSSSGDVSNIASYTVLVGGSAVMELLTYLDNVDYTRNNTIEAVSIDPDSSVTSVDWQIISLTNDYAEVIFSKTTTGPAYGTMTIPAYTLTNSTSYILKLRPSNNNGSWKYIQFRTMEAESNITQLYVNPTSVTLHPGEETKLNIISSASDITYTVSGQEGVFSFNQIDGIITANNVNKYGQGTIEITARSIDAEPKTIRVEVNVKDPVKYKLTLDDGTILEENDSYEFNTGDIINIVIE